MTFAAPLFLIAAAAGIIPVILHMINRQKAKDMPFSTLRFLRISAEKTRRASCKWGSSAKAVITADGLETITHLPPVASRTSANR